jgi:hypothetical protein
MYAPRSIALVISLAGAPSTARAGEQLAVAAGIAEDISVPAAAHEGAYSYAAVAVVIPAGPVAVVPSVGVEYAPDTGHWGFIGTVVVDTPITRSVGFDVIVSGGHDQPGSRWHEAAFAAGGGIGLSITTRHAVISPSVCMFADVGTGELSITPGVSVARVF